MRALLTLGAFGSASAHVALRFPPPTTISDFIQTCPDYDESQPLTNLTIGETYELEWWLGRPHEGGLWVGFNREGAVGDTEWGSTTDTTGTTFDFTVPAEEDPCEAPDCLLVFYNRAEEFCSGGCPFISCANVNLVAADSNECPGGCNDHGTCTDGACVCDDHWQGEYCFDYYECDDDLGVACAGTGQCVNQQCFCPTDFWGDDCATASELTADSVDIDSYPASVEASADQYYAYWTLDEGVLEMVIRAQTESWVGFGIRSDTSAGYTMGYNDMVLGAATADGLQRVKDVYSFDRRTPVEDGFNSDGSTNDGVQSLLDKNAWQDGDWTYMAFRRAIDTGDDSGYDNVIYPVDTTMVWAHGQAKPYDPEIPDPHGNDDFYTVDKPLYHGSDNKGSLTTNFFDLGAGCLSSQLEGYYDLECQYEFDDDFTLHYTVDTDAQTVDVAGVFNSAGGWHAFGFSADTSMPNSDVVAHYDNDTIAVYSLTAYAFPDHATSFVDFTDLAYEVDEDNDQTIISFSRPFDANGSVVIDPSMDTYVLYAFGDSDMPIYHDSNRAVQAAIPGDSDDDSCTASTLPDWDCQSQLSSAFTIHWTLGADTISMGGQFTGRTDGWAAFGVSADTKMTDSDIAATGDDASTVAMYHLSAYSFPSSADSSQTDVDLSVAVDDDVVITWTRAYDNGGSAGPISATGDNYILFAWGDSSDPNYHGTSKNIVALNFATGSTTKVPVNEDKVAHGALMTAAWGFLLPMGVAFARNKDRFDGPLWFHLHRVFQVAGLVCATIGFAIAIDKLGPLDTTHGTIGIMVMTVGWFQPLNAFVRPHPGPEPKRQYWEWCHKGLGRLSVVFAFINIFLGCSKFKEQEGDVDEWKAFYYYNQVFVIVWCACMVASEAIRFRAQGEEGGSLSSSQQQRTQELSIDVGGTQ